MLWYMYVAIVLTDENNGLLTKVLNPGKKLVLNSLGNPPSLVGTLK